MMVIDGAKVFEENGTFQERAIGIRDGRIVQADSIAAAGGITDASGLYAVPGLIDIHFHGCAGRDFSEGKPEAIAAIAAYELSQGITTICPATMTLPAPQIAKICRIAGTYQNQNGATLRGIHLEGPFLSPAKKGAHKSDDIIPPDSALLRIWLDLSKGLCRLVDIAPEIEGAMEFIRAVRDDITVSLAHTTADYDTAMQAFSLGATHITHLYNAMPALTHRAPGVIGAGADRQDIYAELICDGVHVHPAVIRATLKLYGDDRIIFISDSMAATGRRDGQYILGGQSVTVRGNRATLADGTLAGSVTHLMDCVRFAVQKAGVPLGTAIKCATVNPAKSIGIYDTVGSLTPGKTADILLLDEQLRLVRVIHDGREYRGNDIPYIDCGR